MKFKVHTDDLCKLFNVSPTTITHWARQGMPKTGRNEFDLHEVWEWRYENALKSRLEELNKLERESARLKAAQADIAEMQVENAKNQLLLLDDVSSILADYLTQLKNHFLTLPARLAPKLMGISLKDVKLAIETGIKETLNSFEYQFKEALKKQSEIEIDFVQTKSTGRKTKPKKATNRKQEPKKKGGKNE